MLNPKHEILNSKQIRMIKIKISKQDTSFVLNFEHLGF